MSKHARFARLRVIEAIDFRHRLGYAADCHRIDPRAYGRLRGEDTATAADALRPFAVPASSPSPGDVPSSPRFRDAA